MKKFRVTLIVENISEPRMLPVYVAIERTGINTGADSMSLDRGEQFSKTFIAERALTDPMMNEEYKLTVR